MGRGHRHAEGAITMTTDATSKGGLSVGIYGDQDGRRVSLILDQPTGNAMAHTMQPAEARLHALALLRAADFIDPPAERAGRAEEER